MTCIFSSANAWATIRIIAPDCFERIASRERQFGFTIRHGLTVRQVADRGRPYPAAMARPDLVRQALSPTWDQPILVDPAAWQMPAGAFGEMAGPS